jgi:nucleotide-binding universal stress UspA family protein
MKTIAILTDFTQGSQNAVTYAVELARALQAQLVLLHVHLMPLVRTDFSTGLPGAGWTDPVLYPAESLMIDQEIEPILKERLQEQVHAIQAAQGQDLTVWGELLVGRGMEAASIYAAHESVGLLVMGSKGANSTLDRWLGTNAADVMSHAPCPVLSVPATLPFKGFSPMVYATDPAHESLWHAYQLQAIGQMLGAEITVLHVQEEGDKSDHLWKTFSQEWAQVAPALTFVRVFSSKVVHSIEAYVQEHHAQVLIVAKQHYSFMEGLFHSSATDRLTQDNVIPVLSFPALPEDGKEPRRTIFSA